MSPALIVWKRVLELHCLAVIYEKQLSDSEANSNSEANRRFATERYNQVVAEMITQISILRRSGVLDRLTAFLDAEGLT